VAALEAHVTVSVADPYPLPRLYYESPVVAAAELEVNVIVGVADPYPPPRLSHVVPAAALEAHVTVRVA